MIGSSVCLGFKIDLCGVSLRQVGTPCNGLYEGALPERRIFFRFHVHRNGRDFTSCSVLKGGGGGGGGTTTLVCKEF